jgi:hypothetical protein
MMELDMAAPALLNHDAKATGHDARVRDAPIARITPHLIE